MSENNRPLAIVFGSSRTKDNGHLNDAECLGRLLVEAGYDVGSGGYSAVMDRVSKGAHEAGGYVVGYTTDQFPDAVPSRWLTEERRTPDVLLRIRRMLQEGDAFIALWGGIGTLTEVVVTWSMGQVLADTGGRVKPLLLVGAHWPPLVRCIGEQTEIGDGVLAYPQLCATVEEAVVRLRDLREEE
ncbi:MAG: LOG family protein [Anaerolineae bacterium]